jgi:hypothetical protein
MKQCSLVALAVFTAVLSDAAGARDWMLVENRTGEA